VEEGRSGARSQAKGQVVTIWREILIKSWANEGIIGQACPLREDEDSPKTEKGTHEPKGTKTGKKNGPEQKKGFHPEQGKRVLQNEAQNEVQGRIKRGGVDG